jgi:hypothetical protein
MRVRVAGKNQDESKRPLKRRRTRYEILRKPLMEECGSCCYHYLTRPKLPVSQLSSSLLLSRLDRKWENLCCCRNLSRNEWFDLNRAVAEIGLARGDDMCELVCGLQLWMGGKPPDIG